MVNEMTDKPLDCAGNTGHIGTCEISHSDEYLAGIIALAMREGGKTCDAMKWDLVLAWKAVKALRLIGALK